MPFEIDNDFENVVQIKVIGVGGGGAICKTGSGKIPI